MLPLHLVDACEVSLQKRQNHFWFLSRCSGASINQGGPVIFFQQKYWDKEINRSLQVKYSENFHLLCKCSAARHWSIGHKYRPLASHNFLFTILPLKQAFCNSEYWEPSQCTMVPLSTRSCLKSNKLRPILIGQFYHAIFKNIVLNLFGSKQPREILVFVILKL